MAKVITKSTPKNKKAMGPDGLDMDQIWEEEKMPPPKALTESLKRISEHAKDWEEMPRPRKEPMAAPAKESALIPSRPTPRSSVNWTKWATFTGIILIIMMGAQIGMTAWQTMTLQASMASMEKLNANSETLKGAIEALIDAESPGRID